MSRPSIAALVATAAAGSGHSLPDGFPAANTNYKGYAQRLAEAMKTAIDAELVKIEQAFAHHDGTIAAAQADADAAIADAATAQSAADAAQGAADAAAADAATADGKAVAAQSAADAAQSAADAAQSTADGAVSDAAGALLTAQNAQADATQALANAATADAKAVAAQAAADSNHTDLTTLEARVDDIVSNTDPAALDSLSEIVAQFTAADSNLQTAITNALGTHTSELNAYTTSNDAAVAAIQQEIANLWATVNP